MHLAVTDEDHRLDLKDGPQHRLRLADAPALLQVLKRFQQGHAVRPPGGAASYRGHLVHARAAVGRLRCRDDHQALAHGCLRRVDDLHRALCRGQFRRLDRRVVGAAEFRRNVNGHDTVGPVADLVIYLFKLAWRGLRGLGQLFAGSQHREESVRGNRNVVLVGLGAEVHVLCDHRDAQPLDHVAR